MILSIVSKIYGRICKLKPISHHVPEINRGRNGRKLDDNGNIYEWDHLHNDIEKYSRTGRHLGTIDPTTGDLIKGAVRGRTIVP